MSAYDLFLSYHSLDRESVQTVRRLLEARGVAAFLDRENLIVGQPWPWALEEALRSVRAVAVFLGPHGLGPWQKREMWFALDRQVQEEAGRVFPVIPVLLHGVPEGDITTSFLFLNTWVDLRPDLTDSKALDALAQAVRGTAPTRPTELTITLCPYRGLRAFHEEDAAFFFGREAFAERLSEKTLGRNLVAVVGPSGSGKSSVVQAGLLPLLHRQRPPALTWDAVSFTPGDRPFHGLAAELIPLLEPSLSEVNRLAEAQNLGDCLASGKVLLEAAVARILTRSQGTDRLLLVTDQFEELFTLTPEVNRQPFVKALLQAQDRAPLSLLLTLRADFYGHAIALNRDLSDRLEGGVVNLGPMTRKELEQAIVEPAKRVGLVFEHGLVGSILDDIAGEPGNLPLLEFALTELWERRQGGLLTHATYEDSGKVAGAIAQRAETTFKSFTPEQQKTVRLVFSRLVRVARPEEGGEDTRQRVNLSDLDAETRKVVRALANTRLLVTGRDEATGEETLEVAHEALIRHWTRLRSWLDEDREFLLWRERLRADLAEWLRTSRLDEGTLLRGAPLFEAQRWMARRLDDLNYEEQGFIQKSLALLEREEAAREEEKRRLQEAYEKAERQREEAERQRQNALARQLAAQAELARSSRADLLSRSMLLAVESMRLSPSLEADQTLRHGLALLPRPLARLKHEGSVQAVALSPDGRFLATASQDHTVRIWDVQNIWDEQNRREEAQLKHESVVTAINIDVSVAFSPDGRFLATAGGDHTARVWEVPSGRQVVRLTHPQLVWAVVFSPDGRYLATASQDHSARIWEVTSRREVACMTHKRTIKAVAFSPDGRYLATASQDHSARVWGVPSGREVAHVMHEDLVWAVAFSRDGRYLATASQDRSARVWEATNGRGVARISHEREVRTVTFGPDGISLATASGSIAHVWEVPSGREIARMIHEDQVCAVAFSLDGCYLATASADCTARIWESSGYRQVVCITPSDKVNAVAFSPDGALLVTTANADPLFSQDNAVQLWKIVTGRKIGCMKHDGGTFAVVFSPNGSFLATASGDRTARVWDVASGQQVVQMIHDDLVWGVTFSPDGTSLATASLDGMARVWEAASGRKVACMWHGRNVTAVAFSPDGTHLATASADNKARIWEVASGQQVVQMIHDDLVWAVTFSPDGTYLATASMDGTARVWEVAGGREIAHLSHGRNVVAVAFSSDGRHIATASSDHTARVWEATSGREVARLAHEGSVKAVVFSPDDRHVATASADHTARIWEWETIAGREVTRLTHEGTVWTVAFSPDGRHLATASADRTTRVWLWRPEDLIAEACARLTRNLKLEEWRQYLGNESYRKTCPNLPDGRLE